MEFVRNDWVLRRFQCWSIYGGIRFIEVMYDNGLRVNIGEKFDIGTTGSATLAEVFPKIFPPGPAPAAGKSQPRMEPLTATDRVITVNVRFGIASPPNVVSAGTAQQNVPDITRLIFTTNTGRMYSFEAADYSSAKYSTSTEATFECTLAGGGLIGFWGRTSTGMSAVKDVGRDGLTRLGFVWARNPITRMPKVKAS